MDKCETLFVSNYLDVVAQEFKVNYCYSTMYTLSTGSEFTHEMDNVFEFQNQCVGVDCYAS